MRTLIKPLLTLSLISVLVIGAIAGDDKPDDNDITNAINNELLLNPTTLAYTIDVETNDGIVTLSGTTTNILERDRAVKIAQSVKGVRAVINKIEVDIVERPNDELKKDVVDALLFDPATESFEVDVVADNGVVTLSGKVESWQEKQLSEYVAKGVKGVKEVHNNISFTFAQNRPDYEIKKDIEQMLHHDIRIDDGLVDVKVKNGKVTLTGTVGSSSERILAYNKAWVSGVESVSNKKLEVKTWARDEMMRKDKYVQKSDEAIKQAVEDAFLYDPRVFSFKPKVEVINGIVTLTGYVSNLEAKRAAEQDARNVVGVFSVDNHLKISRDVVPQDEAIELDITGAFLRDAYIDTYELSVNVKSGVAYLTGNVDSYFEKYRAGNIAEKVEGVLKVKNYIHVDDITSYHYNHYYGWGTTFPPNYINTTYDYKGDAEIESNIESQIWWSPYVNKSQVDVSVEDRIAILTGNVDTWREKYYAELNAYQGGADDVINKLKIAYSSDAMH